MNAAHDSQYLPDTDCGAAYFNFRDLRLRGIGFVPVEFWVGFSFRENKITSTKSRKFELRKGVRNELISGVLVLPAM
jgi:hypothetical protein